MLNCYVLGEKKNGNSIFPTFVEHFATTKVNSV